VFEGREAGEAERTLAALAERDIPDASATTAMKPAEDGADDRRLLFHVGRHRALPALRPCGAFVVIEGKGVRHSRMVGKAANGLVYCFEHSG